MNQLSSQFSASGFNRQMGASGSAIAKNQHEIVNQNKQYGELKKELDKEKESSTHFQKLCNQHHLMKLVEKALEEIQYYVDRYGAFIKDDEELEKVSRTDALRRDFDFQKLEPLLKSYESTIKELKQLSTSQQIQIKNLTDRAESYVQENIKLREELQKKCQIILDIYQNGNPQDHIANLFKKIERDDLSDKINQLTDENHDLIAKYKELRGHYLEQQKKLQDAITQQNHLKLQDQTRQKELQDQKEINQQLEDLSENQRKELLSIQSKFSGTKTKAEQLDINNIRLQKDYKQQYEKTIQLQNQLEDQAKNLQKQISDLMNEIRLKDKQIKDQEGEIQKYTEENKYISDQNTAINKQIDQTIADYDKQKSDFEELDRKYKQLVVKEEKQAQLQGELNEKLSTITIEKDKYLVKSQQSEKTLNNVEEQNKKQMEELKRDKDKTLDQTRSKMKIQIDHLENHVEELQNQLQIQNNSLEAKKRESHKFKQEKDEMAHLLKTDRFKLENDNEYLKKKVLELEEIIQRREQLSEEKITGLKLDKDQLEQQNNNIQQLYNQLKIENEQLRKKSNQLEVSNYELKEKVTTMTRSQINKSMKQ
ncbi:hypothetical protein pb186bvf_019312 [Paramecium bursaria]